MIDRRRIFDLWEHRDDPNAAAATLAIMAECQLAGEPVPRLIALWHSRAVERMIATDSGRDGEPAEAERLRAYARALGMSRSDNRPVKFVSCSFVAQSILGRVDKG